MSGIQQLLASFGSAALNTSMTPGVGAITLAGRSPDFFSSLPVLPGTGAVVLTGRAPSATVNSPAVSTWSTTDKNAAMSLSGGNLIASITGSHGAIRGTQGRDAATANHYFEVTIAGFDAAYLGGIGNASATLNFFPGDDANGWAFNFPDGQKYNNLVNVAYAGAALPSTIGILLSGGNLSIYTATGVTPGVAYSGLTGTMYPMFGPGSGSGGPRTMTLNVGASTLLYGLPAGATYWG